MKRSIIDTFFQHVLLSRKTKIAKLTADLAVEYRNREPVQTLKLEAGREVLATSERLVKGNPKIKLSDLEVGIRKEMEFFGSSDRRSPLTGRSLYAKEKAEGVIREFTVDSEPVPGIAIEEANARQDQPLIEIPNDGTRIEGIESGNVDNQMLVNSAPANFSLGIEDKGQTWHDDPTKTTIDPIEKSDFDYKWYEKYARIGPFVVVDTEGRPVTREQLEQHGWIIPPEERKEDGQPAT